MYVAVALTARVKTYDMTNADEIRQSKKISNDQIPHPALKTKREITKYIK